METTEITSLIERYYDLSEGSIQINTRKRVIVQARQIAMYFTKKLTKLSLSQIGWRIGKKDHATVLHAIRTCENLIQTDKEFRTDMDYFREKFRLNLRDVSYSVTLYIENLNGDMTEEKFSMITDALSSYNEKKTKTVTMIINYYNQQQDIRPVPCEMNFNG